MSRVAVIAAIIGLVASAAAQTPKTVFEGRQEILWLDHWAQPDAWTPAECEVKASPRQVDGHPVAHIHIPVDYHAGEAKYPVGWPRAHVTMRQPWERDWRSWDRFEFQVFTEFSRDALPKTPVTLLVLCPGRNRQWTRNLAELQIGRWVRFSIPASEMKFRDQVAAVKFSIAESNYRDHDLIDFHIGGFRFVRSAECELSSMAVTTPALFRDQGALRVAVDVAGPPPKVARGVPFSIRDGRREWRRETLPVVRGPQTLVMEVAELKLPPGNYSLVAFPDDPARRKTATFRIVDSPWKDAR